MKYLVIFLFSFFIIKNTATAQTNYGMLEGKLMSQVTKEGLIAASVTLYKAGEKTPVNGTSTDINGIFSIDSIPVGVYDVEFSYVGYCTMKRVNVHIKNTVIRLDMYLLEGGLSDKTEITTLTIPLIDAFGMGRVYNSRDIKNSPLKW